MIGAELARACGQKRKPPRLPGGLSHGAEPLGLVGPLHASPTPARLFLQGTLGWNLAPHETPRETHRPPQARISSECASLLVDKQHTMLKSRRYSFRRRHDNAPGWSSAPWSSHPT